ncbi:3-deoxy-D-manno-octulosonic acid transferase [Microvirga sp. W0021]|uniref:3-deoxy-D-manno-octulosonic acid transferase n=1 Tax=Hohaiivirga grylli TaxID=3133970 RepID=A0ABV0BJ89_9HYPH
MKKRLPPLLKLYRRGLSVLEPMAFSLLLWRRKRGLEDRTRLAERQGYPGKARPAGHLAWVHGASNGEALSLLPIIERLTQRGLHVLVTTGTKTSAVLVARRLPPGALHQFVPLDVPRYTRRFLDYWRPDIVLVAESELWPNTIVELADRNIPLILVNGRMSERSFKRWQKIPGFISALLERIALCMTQTLGDAERMSMLGAPRVSVAGNLKFDAPPPPADPHVFAQLTGLISGRPVWVAASTHPGEEEIILQAHKAILARHPQLLTIIVPRHPRRGADIQLLCQQAGLKAALRSQGLHPDRATDIYIADTVGELGLFYRLAPLAYIGGSLVPHGGQNPIEPAKLGSAIIHGPHVHNFKDIYTALDEDGGALKLASAENLAPVVADLLSDTGLMREMSRTAGDTVNKLGGAVDRTMMTIEPFITQLKLETRQ